MYITNDNSKLTELNICPQITKIQNINLLAKCNVVIEQKISDDIQKIFTDFIWPGKHFIKKETLYCCYEDGGLR